MKKKTLSRILLCIGAAALVLAAALFWFLPRQADDVLEIADPDSVVSLYVIYAAASSDMDTWSVDDEALLDELADLLSRTTLHLKGRYNGIEYDDELYSVHITSLSPISFRPDGSVYCNGWRYTQGEDTLAEYMSLLPRLLSAASFTSEELASYQSLFDAGSWYAQAVARPFDDCRPDLNALLYDGLSYDENGQPVYGGAVKPEDGAEWDWVCANVPGGDTLDVSRLPREGMLQVLQEIFYPCTPVPDDLVPQDWTYWEETDCYYNAHGDTGLNPVTLTNGHRTDGGSGGVLYFLDTLGTTYRVYYLESPQPDGTTRLHLRSCSAVD